VWQARPEIVHESALLVGEGEIFPTATAFTGHLSERPANRVQLSSNALAAYAEVFRASFLAACSIRAMTSGRVIVTPLGIWTLVKSHYLG
jgi:hypothetical protein